MYGILIYPQQNFRKRKKTRVFGVNRPLHTKNVKLGSFSSHIFWCKLSKSTHQIFKHRTWYCQTPSTECINTPCTTLSKFKHQIYQHTVHDTVKVHIPLVSTQYTALSKSTHHILYQHSTAQCQSPHTKYINAQYMTLSKFMHNQFETFG